MWITSSLDTVRTPTAIALGNFDGIHQGHWKVIQPILSGDANSKAILDRPAFQWLTAPQLDAAEERSDGKTGPEQSAVRSVPYSTVVTFHPHPQEFFTGRQRPLLTPLDEKVRYLRAMGVEQLVLLPFNQALAAMSPEQFVDAILIQQLQARQISVGQDFCFGRNRSGTTAVLQAIAATHGVSVQITPLYTQNGERVSSSAIRQALQDGDIAQANRLLGRPYALIGDVVQGQQLGRTLGFPTANLHLPPEKFLPRRGVYSVWVSGLDSSSEAEPAPGVMNIGYRPTVNGMAQTIEVHLLDWSGDLYGKVLKVDLDTFLRPEQKFDSLDALKAQIQADCDRARSLLNASHLT